MSKLICTNYGKCALANDHEDFSHEKGHLTRCPLCDRELSEVRTPSQSNSNNSLFILVFSIVVLLLYGLATDKKWLGGSQGAGAAESKEPPHTILRLAGSNTVGASLGPALAEAFLKAQGGTNVQILPGANLQEKIVRGVLPGDDYSSSITIAAHGSATAFTALGGYACDIGMSSRRIKPDEAAKLGTMGDMTSAGSEHIIGLDGITVIVNASNRLSELRKDEVKRIFTGGITDWSQVGPMHGAIKIYVSDDNSGTTDTFKNVVLGGLPLAPSARRFEDSNALSEAVSSDPNGIGLVGLPFVHDAKSIAISEKGAHALKPTRLTIATEEYSLSRRLYLYTPANPRNKFMQMFVEFAVSKAGQDVVAGDGFVSQNVVPVKQPVSSTAPDEYKELTQDAERLSLDFRFEAGNSGQDNKAQLDLDRVVSLVADQGATGSKIMLLGFTDNSGTPEVNQALSLNRAKMVEDQLIQRGLKPGLVRGFGSELAVASNDTQEGREKNRRVEIWMTK